MQHRPFHGAAQHAAAHEPGVDIPGLRGVRRGPADRDARHAEIAEAVLQPDLESEYRRVLLDRGDFGLGVAPRGQIELIGLVDELDDPPAARRIERRQLDDHSERLEIVLDVPGDGLGVGTADLGRVCARASEIFIREGDRFEAAGRAERPGVPCRIRGELRNHDGR